MIRYILVDDEPRVLKRVKAEIDTISKNYELKHIASFDSSKKAFEEVDEADYDLLIVDFEMPVYNGDELAEKIARDKKIIFLTSTSGNEQKIINRLDIAGYLSKPFDIDEFKPILKNKIIGKINTQQVKENRDIILPIGESKNKSNIIKIIQDKIYYISTYDNVRGIDSIKKNCVNFYGKNDEIIHENVRITIEDLTEKLSDSNFIKINKTALINISYFKKKNRKNIYLFDSKSEFSLSTSQKEIFIEKLNNLN
ncbi:LytR/AlgR family response regulator transcription factor [Tenacibaculum maritimum]|uniref:LytR/AlgR family response regulator transcription factor n=2 Tax=Tenacibaculum maritimum TaxID=107401 RepID=UPI0012E6594D|nr:response regulator [Tenacibaculum maritimum]MCD9564133.1 response regulator [Tenacibaculum maritimum]MCD9566952.1 response regulator [Tenacibaculum maritimum]MCD9580226.1 response regulator [Tenacibaculum maritimum]MCD9585460.1 response regulator [Tenacibaculum maritimum]MCD9597902.1 response regulator [Tenacibaculum maritimum]